MALTFGHVNSHQRSMQFTVSWFIFKFYLFPSPAAALKRRGVLQTMHAMRCFLRVIPLWRNQQSMFLSASRGLAAGLLDAPCLSHCITPSGYTVLLLGTRLPFPVFLSPCFSASVSLCRSVTVYLLPYLSKTKARSSQRSLPRYPVGGERAGARDEKCKD